MIISLTLITLSSFLTLNVFASVASEKLKDKVDVTINFKDSAPEELIQDFQQQLSQTSGISVSYISKEEAMEVFRSRSGIRQNIRELVTAENNPLPRGLRVKSADLAFLDQVNMLVQAPKFVAYIDSSNYEDNKVIIDKINNATRFIRQLGIVATILFIIISVIVVFNAVRLAVESRKEEIEIMRLVGASETYVRTPFLVEGSLYGFIGIIVSLAVLIGAALYLTGALAGYFSDLDINIAHFFTKYLWQVIVVEIVVAVVLCITCSWLSVRKHIKI